MNKKTTWIFVAALIGLAFIFSLAVNLSCASALVYVDGVEQGSLYPGNEATIDITVNNDFDYDIEDVSVNLVFSSSGSSIIPSGSSSNNAILFTPVGSSTDSVDEIKDGDSEDFSFKIKASNSISPGDYVLGYVINYKNLTTPIIGSIGITVNSKTSLDYSVNQETKVVGMNDKITLKIYNKGYGDVRFVIVNAEFSGATLLSEKKAYIGNIASDDFETATYNILINSAYPKATFTINYKDFENNDKTEALNFDLTAYSREKALELGLIKKNNTPFIIAGIILIAIIWFIIRAVRKARARRQKLKLANQIK